MKVRHLVPAMGATTAVVVLGLGALTGVSTAQPFHHRHHPTTTTRRPTTTTSRPTTTTTVKPTTTTTVKPTTTTTRATTTTTVQQTTTSGPTTTVASTTTTGASGGTCTSPIFTTSDAEGTINIDSGSPPAPEFWWVNNDAWSGSHGPQTLQVCSQSSWNALSTQPDNGGAVETYPDTEYDVGGRNNGVSTKPISAFNSITSTFSESYPSAGSWDAAYDMWTNNWSNETMVWNQWAGSQAYWFTASGFQDVTIGGIEYHFCDNGANGNCSGPKGADNGDELIFAMVNQETSGSVNILAIYNWEVTNGYAKASDAPTQLEYGVEVCSTSGQETFPMTGLTFSVS